MNAKLNIKIAIVLLAFFCITTNGYTYTQKFPKDSTSCIDNNGEHHAVNTEWYDKKKCERITCEQSNGILHMYGAGCPSFATDCETKMDHSAEYPDCCPKIVSCPN